MITDENISLGFRDLLFNSGVACLLLFIIFSVKIGSKTIDAENGNSTSSKNFAFFDDRSLIIDKTKKEGKYSFILALEISEINRDEFNRLFKQKDMWIKPFGVDNSKEVFISHNNSTMTIYLILNQIKSSNVGFLIGHLSLSDIGVKPIRAKLLDGIKNIDDSNVFYISKTVNKNLSNSNSINFNIGNSNKDELNNQNIFLFQ